MRRPLVIYDFATAPFMNFLKHEENLIVLQCTSHPININPNQIRWRLVSTYHPNFPNQISQTPPSPSNNIKNAERICISRLPFPLNTFPKMMQENKKFVRVFYILFGVYLQCKNIYKGTNRDNNSLQVEIHNKQAVWSTFVSIYKID
jgi:hypothetical protein